MPDDLTPEQDKHAATWKDTNVSYKVRGASRRRAGTDPPLPRGLKAVGLLFVAGGIILGVPLGIFGGYLGAADSQGVSVTEGVTYGLVIFAAIPIGLGVMFLLAARTSRRHPRRPI